MSQGLRDIKSCYLPNPVFATVIWNRWVSSEITMLSSSNLNTDSKLVSVLLPVFNGERYLARAIESVLQQSYENFELIIFDDFSTDQSLRIIEAFAARDSRIKHWRSAQRLGVYENFNQCLGQAQGYYIKPFAQDDLLGRDALKVMVRQMEAHPSVSLLCIGSQIIDIFSEPITRNNIEGAGQGADAKYVDAKFSGADAKFKGLGKANSAYIFKPGRVVPSSEVLENCLFPLANPLGEPSSMMFKAEAQGKGFDSRLHQFADVDYWMRIVMNGDYLIVPDVHVEIRRHGGCATLLSNRSMMGACDLIKISRKYGKVIEALGHTVSEFLDLAISAYITDTQALISEGTITLDSVQDSRDLVAQAKEEATRAANNTATMAFSSLAQALAVGDVACLSFTSPEDEVENRALLEDMIDFREFTFRLLKLVGKRSKRVTSEIIVPEVVQVVR